MNDNPGSGSSTPPGEIRPPTKPEESKPPPDLGNASTPKQQPPKYLTWVNSIRRWAEKRENVLRLVIVCCLLGLLFVGFYFPYYFFRLLERQVATKEYDLVVNVAERSFIKGMSDKLGAIDNMATIFSGTCPNHTTWPNCSLAPDIFDALSDSVTSISGALSIGMAPFVTTEEVYGFESFANEKYAAAGLPSISAWQYPSGKGGVAALNAEGELVHNTEPSELSAYGYLLPVIMFTGAATRGRTSSILFNIQYEQNRITAIDSAIDCRLEHPTASCHRITDFLVPLLNYVPAPAAYLMKAVEVDGSLAALVFSTHYWGDLIEESFPEYVEGVDAVLRSGTRVFSFTFNRGSVKNIREGDHHDSAYDDTEHSFYVDVIAGDGSRYYLSLYASADYYHRFEDDRAVYASVIGGTIVVLTTLFFFAYDLLLSRSARENAVVLATKRAFVRYISHEIRTPLNTVNVGLKVLSQEVASLGCWVGGNEDGKRDGMERTDMKTSHFQESKIALLALVEDIADSSDAAVDVLNDLINYDKICMGTMILELHVIDVFTLVENACQPFVLQARQDSITMTLDVDEARHARVIGDDVKLMQCLRNLLSNALKFTHCEGTIKVSVRWNKEGTLVTPHCDWAEQQGCRCAQTGSIKVSVVDSGAGISAEHQLDLFKEGVQFNANKLQGGKGSGLGLFITKGIVSLHGGVISAYSEGEGRGCEFSIELPAVDMLIPDGDKSGARGRLDSSRDSSDSKEISLDSFRAVADTLRQQDCPIRNILIVDDSAPSRKMVARLLRNSGYTCFEAEDGQLGVDLMLSKRGAPPEEEVHMVLMDFEMPVLNGPLATRRLRELGFSVPIVGLTGNVLQVDVKLFMDHGANAVLAKPLNLGKLRDILASLTRCEDPILAKKDPSSLEKSLPHGTFDLPTADSSKISTMIGLPPNPGKILPLIGMEKV